MITPFVSFVWQHYYNRLGTGNRTGCFFFVGWFFCLAGGTLTQEEPQKNQSIVPRCSATEYFWQWSLLSLISCSLETTGSAIRCAVFLSNGEIHPAQGLEKRTFWTWAFFFFQKMSWIVVYFFCRRIRLPFLEQRESKTNRYVSLCTRKVVQQSRVASQEWHLWARKKPCIWPHPQLQVCAKSLIYPIQ